MFEKIIREKRDFCRSLFEIAFFFSELCWGKAMVAYTIPPTKEERRNRKANGREIRLCLLILDLKDGKL